MTSLQFRRNLTKEIKLKKQTRASDTSLLTLNSNVKNYLSYFNLNKSNNHPSNSSDKENQNLSKEDISPLPNQYTPKSGLRKKQSQICFTRKSQNNFSLEKPQSNSRIPFADKFGLRNIENNANQQGNSQARQKQSQKTYSVQKTEKKGYSLNKHNQYYTYQSIDFQVTYDNKNRKSIPYFIDCFLKKNKLMTQALLHIHMSLITFKTFKRACMFAKAKNPCAKVPKETPGRKTIIFDMDETLIHTNELITPGYEIKVPFRSVNGRIIYGYVCVRPYAKQILKNLSQHFDILVFTAGSQPYADPILDYIDPDRVIQHRLYRQSCTLVDNQVFVKDLRIVGRSLENVVLVDNAPHCYMLQINNGIPILPYYKGKQDKQLYSLQNYLMGLKEVEDVRKVNAETFQLEDYFKHDSKQRIVANLYSKHL